MNERNPMLHCPEAYDIVMVSRGRDGAAIIGANARQIQSHEWRESREPPRLPDNSVFLATYYCIRCTSTRNDAGQLQYKNIGEAPPDATADKVTPIRKG